MPKIGADSYNLQSKTRFMLSLPISQIIGDYDSLKDFTLNVTSFSTPEIAAGFTSTSYLGYETPIPNGNRVEEKLLTIRFLVSENLIQYAVMLAWINQVTAAHVATQNLSSKLYTTAQLWFLDSFLKPQIPITYEGLCIARLGSLTVDQTEQDSNPLVCDASFRYVKSELDVVKIITGKAAKPVEN